MLYHCQVCGKPFNASPAARRKVCSRACMGVLESKQVPRICERCGKEFTVPPNTVAGGRGRFCSRACADYGWDEPCQQCGKPVHRTESRAKAQKHIFCSRECYGAWKSRKVEQNCQQCGKAMLVKPSDIATGEGKFCSLACFNQARARMFVTLTCQQCGKEYERPSGLLSPHNYQGKYCSNRCSALARRLPDSARSIYSHEFTDKLKRSIRKRDGYRCQECGKRQRDLSRQLDIHHINYLKTDNHPDNLDSLCQSCHTRTNYDREKWERRYQDKVHQRQTALPSSS